MTQRSLTASRFLGMLAAVVGLFLATAPLWAEPEPGENDPLVAKMVCLYLEKGHLKQPEFDQKLADEVVHRFVKDLDPTKGYFLQSDIDDFERDVPGLATQLEKGDLSFAYKVYRRLVKRIGERLPTIEELINAKHDYTVKEYLSTDFDKIPWAKDNTELRERWRKRLKFDLLAERLGERESRADRENPPDGDHTQGTKSEKEKPLTEAEAREKVLKRYQSVQRRWKQFDNYDLMELYLTDLTTSVDPHSSYMSPNTVDDFNIAMRLHLEGIGAVLRSENGQTIITEVVPGGAAGTDGRLKPEDKIVGVAQGDGQFVDVVDMKLREVVKLIRGHKGTKVQLKVIPAGKIQPVIIALTRQNIELKSQEARGEVVTAGKKEDGTPYRIGVIDVPSFYSDSSEARSGGKGTSVTKDVRRILENFNSTGVDGVVLDLRRNGGGALSEALSLTGLFIDKGPVVQVKGSNGRVSQRDDPEEGTVYAGPVMVLISRFSASASEILAGALQDYDRALIVGDPSTHGKGTVQAVLDLGDRFDANPPPKLGALKLTVQQFYRVNGDSTQNRGVVADVIVPSLTEVLSDGEKELEHALRFDRVAPAEHEDLHLVSPELKAILQARSTERVKHSKDFARLAKVARLLREAKARKSIPLNEKELKSQFAQEETEKAEQKASGVSTSDNPRREAKYKFRRNFINNEILRIMEDFIQGKKLLAEK
jgi:carboxyl-terminal processing protease